MALIYADRVRESTTTTGTGTYTLAGARTGFQAFSDVMSNTDTCYYSVTDDTNWEVGVGTYSSGTLARTTVLDSSTGSAISWGAGDKDIFLTNSASKVSDNQTKLDGIATGATANDTDANLKNRANHTGTQTASTISDFDTEVANNSAVTANTAKVSYTDSAKVAGIETGATANPNAVDGSGVATVTVNTTAPSSPATGDIWVDTDDASADTTMDTATYDGAGIAEQVVGTTATQTLTNKTIDGASNTVTGVWWEELARVSASSGTTMDTGTFTAKKYLKIMYVDTGSSSNGTDMRFNGDTGANYSTTRALENAAFSVAVNSTSMEVMGNYGGMQTSNMEFINVSNLEKVGHAQWVSGPRGGTKNSAAQLPVYAIYAMKWVITTQQIFRVQVTRRGGAYTAGSELVVLGHD